MENKHLAIIVAVLLIAVGISGYYAYGIYQTNEMDKYMTQAFVYADKSASQYYEAEVLANQTKYNETIDKIDSSIWNANQVYNLSQKAYQNAKGPYKDFLVVYMKRQKVWIELLDSWKSRIQYFQSGNLVKGAELKKQEENRLNDYNQYDDELSSIIAQNPGMEDYRNKNWNS